MGKTSHITNCLNRDLARAASQPYYIFISQQIETLPACPAEFMFKWHSRDSDWPNGFNDN